MLSRSDEAIIAEVVKSFGGRSVRPGTFARAIASAFEEEGAAGFNRDRFLIACGVPRRYGNRELAVNPTNKKER